MAKTKRSSKVHLSLRASLLKTTHLDRPLQLRLLIAEPHHSYDCHCDAEPVEEAEEVYHGEDVVGEGVEQRHDALSRRREERQITSLMLQQHPAKSAEQQQLIND